MTLPPALRRRVFTRREALDAGMTDRTLGAAAVARDVLHLGYGVWADAARIQDEELELAGVLLRAPYAVASHATAARLWGADPDDGRLHVTVPAELPVRSRPGLVVHRDRLQRSEVAVRAGIAVTDPYRTAIDEARRARAGLGRVRAVAVVDALLAAERIEHRQLVARLAATPSGRGIAIARSVIARSRYGAQSPGETALRLALLDGGVPEPSLQYRIRCRGGLVVVDLCWPEHRLVVEYDGFGPHTERPTFERDRRRWSWLRADGWELRVFTAESVRDRQPEIAAEVLALLQPTSSGRRSRAA